MPETSSRQFSLIVAYLLPGFIGLGGVAPLFPAVGRWLQPVDQGDLGFGPPIYALISAVVVGLIVSCFRWLFLDQFHHWTGVRRPQWDDRRLAGVLSSFDYLVQNHYRYYEFCGNTLVAGLWAYGMNRSMGTVTFLGLGTDLGMVILTLVLFTASRDALAKYYIRTGRLIGQVAERGGGAAMFNGNHHQQEAGSAPSSRNEKGTSSRPVATPKPQAAAGNTPKATK